LHGPYLHLGKRSVKAEIQLQGRHEVALLYKKPYDKFKSLSNIQKLLTTAKLVKTARINHPRVIGGICVTQASIPTGI
jgi:hypothetical protein